MTTELTFMYASEMKEFPQKTNTCLQGKIVTQDQLQAQLKHEIEKQQSDTNSSHRETPEMAQMNQAAEEHLETQLE